jgi:4-carboxymuconolactone decarboxylase
VTHDLEDLLRRLALADEQATESTVPSSVAAAACLDAKSGALVRLAALIALSSATPAYQWCVDLALAAGASDDEVVGVLVTLAPVVGTARLVAAAPEVALSLGCDLDAAFEAPDGPIRE